MPEGTRFSSNPAMYGRMLSDANFDLLDKLEAFSAEARPQHSGAGYRLANFASMGQYGHCRSDEDRTTLGERESGGMEIDRPRNGPIRPDNEFQNLFYIRDRPPEICFASGISARGIGIFVSGQSCQPEQGLSLARPCPEMKRTGRFFRPALPPYRPDKP